jgi:hypothetical protein
LTEFLNKAQERLSQLDAELNAAVVRLGLAPKDITDEDGFIREAEYPELRAKQDELIALTPIPRQVFERFYLYGEQEVKGIEYTIPKEVLDGYGYDETWLTDPVRLSMKAQLYCGEYNGEPITNDFYYNRLKPYMSENIEDC